MFKPVDAKVDFPRLEREILEFWHSRDIFKRSVQERAGGPRFVFYEGPPTANGNPGIHHVLARVFKDLVPRYWTMKGYQVDRKGGWDTHGLPVELEVERELGISSKPEIEAYGIAEFNRRCRESVFRYVKEWETMTDRIGFWIDMEHPYITYEDSYIESCWWILKQLWDRGLVFQDYKVTPHCPRCGTSLSSHELALGYRDDTDDPSIYVKFRLQAPASGELAGVTDAAFLVWTTTPWTLPGNVAIAVNPDAQYALVENRVGEDAPAEKLILASHLIGSALKGKTKILKVFLGSHLIGLTYEPLFSLLPLDKPAHRVVGGDFVSLEDGTGIVHLAPAFGEIDLQVGRAEDLPLLMTVDPRGNVIDAPVPFAGMFVKDADPLITRDLRDRGLIYRSERIKHTYPFCWRCETPLLYYAKTSWYIKTTAMKERLVSANQEINWYPDHIKNGRFGDWLNNNVDWAISRERYWGTPLPFWRCEECGRLEAIGSVAELAERSGRPELVDGLDLHRPYVDEITLPCGTSCPGTMRRTPEVIDVWFESGAMPVAQWHYPFDNRDVYETHFPADYICEAIDQTRGWFYSLHALGVLLRDSPAFKNVICLGHILDSKGEKMSKSRGNVVEPLGVLDKHGADAVRWYLYTTSPPGSPRRFSADLVGEVVRKFLLTLWNTYSFFVIYATIDGFDPTTTSRPAEPAELDRWAISELHALIREVRDRLDNYDPTGAGRAIQEFLEDLSNWYVRRSRRRFWKSENDDDKWSAYHTLYECLAMVVHLLAPFTPFVAEELYQNLVRRVRPDAPESVHLAFFPDANEALIDDALMAETAVVQRVVSLGRAARSKAAIKVRQPLAEVVVKPRSPHERTGLMRFTDQILEELNVKALRFADEEGEVIDYVIKPNLPVVGPKYGKQVGKIAAALKTADATEIAAAVRTNSKVRVDSVELEPNEVLVEVAGRSGYAAAADAGYVVALSTEVTPELAREGLVREVVHRLQTMRKSAGFEIADTIRTYVQADPDLQSDLAAQADYLKQETLTVDLLWQAPPEGAYQETFKVDGREVLAGVQRR